MDELKRMAVFTRVVEAKSFSEAARQLGVAKSAVSKQIQLLEKDVGIRLLNRSSRRLGLTEAGQIFYRHSAEIVQRAHIALSELREYQNQPTGTLRVSSPVAFGSTQLVPVVKELRAMYPELAVELLFEDRVINMVEDNVDIAIRVGWLDDSSMIARQLCEVPMLVFAAPEYLAKHGSPNRPEDLTGHTWIALNLLSSPWRWSFQRRDQTTQVQMRGDLRANSIHGVVEMVKQGLGVSAIAKYMIEEELSTGRLVSLLPEFKLRPIGVHAVYPHRDHMPPKTRVFLEFLSKRCHRASWTTEGIGSIL